MKHIYKFNGFTPVVHPSSFVHDLACIIGNVEIGKDVYVAPGAVIRGDWGRIVVEDGCNIQENCVIHMFPGKTVFLKKGAHIGHGAIIHGANIGANSLVGMNAVIMDEVELGPECIVGALSFLPAKMKVPKRKVVVGNPAVIKKDVSDEMINWKTEGTKLYQQLPKELMQGLEKTSPLQSPPKFIKDQAESYRYWEG